MLYENYYKKVSLIARILGFFRRFRAWFIGFSIAALVAFGIFVALQGLVYDFAPCPDEVVYGDEFEYKAFALFRDVKYEFASESSFESTLEEKPKMPGEYCIRAVSSSFFGTPRYGKTYAFQITQRDIDVSVLEDVIVYGETPTAAAELVYEDALTCRDYSYEDIAEVKTKVTPISETVQILNLEGEDVTYAYNINPVQTDIEFTPRDITVTVATLNKVYDAKPFNFDEFEFDIYDVTGGTEADWGNVGKDTVLFTFEEPAFVDVKSEKNVPATVAVLHPTAGEVTHHYNINVVDGYLHIVKRPVTFHYNTSEDVLNGVYDAEKEQIEYIYDAEQHFFTEYLIDSGTPLVDGHSEKLDTYTRIEDAGTKKNLMSFKFFDENDVEVTDNYSYFVPSLMLKVNQRPVAIEAGDDIKIYDGTALNNSRWEVLPATPGVQEGLLVKHSIKSLMTEGAQVNVGITPNNIVESSIVIVDKENPKKEVTANYKFELLPGELEILPCNIHITTMSSDETFIYNGRLQAYPEFDYEFPNLNGDNADEIREVIETITTLHRFVPVSETLTRVKNVSETIEPIENRFEVQILDSNDNDVTENFEISYDYGTIQLLKRPIEVKAVDKSKVYNALPLASTDWSADGLVEELHDIELTTQTMLPTDVEGEFVAGELVNVGIANNDIIACLIFEKTDDVNAERVDVTENYDVTTIDGTLEITKRRVTITAESRDKIYDAKSMIDDRDIDWNVDTVDVNEIDGLIYDENKEIYHVISQIEIIGGDEVNVGTYGSVIAPGSVRISEIGDPDFDVTENYEIYLVDGVLVIDPRPIKIQTADDDKIYDATPLFNEGWEYTEDSEYEIVEGQLAEVIDRTEIINYREDGVANEFELVIKDGGADVTFNYDIEYVYGTLMIERRLVQIDTIGTLEHEWVYDGEAHSKPLYEYSEGNIYPFVEGQEVVVVNSTRLTDYIEDGVENELEINVFIRDVETDELEDVTYNYIIETVEKGILFIDQREIKIVTDGNIWTYDGEAHSHKVWKYHPETEYEIVDGQTDKVVRFSKITNFIDGGIDNELELQIFSGERDVTNNYIISVIEEGKLVIEKRSITILTNTHSWIYDAQEHSDEGWTYAEGSLFEIVDNGRIEHHIVVDENTVTKITNVLRDENGNVIGILNKFIVGVFDAKDKAVTDNYDITYEYGELKVTPRRLTIETGYHMWKYDGQWHYDPEFKLLEELADDYGLVNDQTLELIIESITKIKDIVAPDDEAPDNELKLKVLDVNNDVSVNYDITYVYGKLFVVEDIKVTTMGDEKVYDSTELTKDEYVTSTLYPGCQFEDIKVIGTQTVVGESENVIEEENVWVSYTDEFGEKHYVICEIEFEYGKLVVTKRVIKIDTDYGEWVYDGKEHSMPTWKYSDDTPYEIVDTQTGKVDGNTVTKITDVERQANEVVGINNMFIINIFSGADDVSENYEIIYNYNQLKVTPRPLTVKTEYKEKIYDDNKPTWSEYVIITNKQGDSDEEVGLLTKHSIRGGRINNSLIGVNVGTYTVEIVSGSLVICESGSDVNRAGNYEITYETDYLKVDPRPVTIETNYHMWKYDGAEHFDADYTIAPNSDRNYGIVSGHTHGAIDSTITKIINIGSVDNELVIAIFKNGEDVSFNYDISYVYGKLFIAEDIKVTTEGDEKVYDGEALKKPGYTVSDLPDGCEFEDVEVIGSRVDVTDDLDTPDEKEGVDNNVDEDKIWISYEDEKGIHHVLCDIEYDYGQLIVTHKHIKLQTGSQKWLYDGWGHYNRSYEIVEGELVPGHEIRVVDSTVIIEEGIVDNVFHEVHIMDASDVNVAHNYNITYAEPLGKLEITRKDSTIWIRLYNVTKEYDGKPLEFDATCYEVVSKDAALEFSFTGKTSILFPGTITAEDLQNANLGFKVLLDGSDVTGQCNVEFVPDVGSLTITPREITLKAADATKEFVEDEPLSNDEVKVIAGSIAEGQTLYAKAVGVNVDQPVVENVVDRSSVKITYVDEYDQVVDVTHCYNIKYQNGTLTLKFPM